MKKMILASAVLLAAFSSCKKDSEPTCELNATSIQGTYKITSVKYKLTASTPEVEVFTNGAWYEVCERDDTYTFSTGNVATYTDAGTTCAGGGSDNTTWSLSGNVLSIGGATYGTVSSFSCTGMSVVATNYDVAGDQATFTFARQ
jgi:hypothetical protein